MTEGYSLSSYRFFLVPVTHIVRLGCSLGLVTYLVRLGLATLVGRLFLSLGGTEENGEENRYDKGVDREYRPYFWPVSHGIPVSILAREKMFNQITADQTSENRPTPFTIMVNNP